MTEYQAFLEYLERGHMVQEELNELSLALEAAEGHISLLESRAGDKELGELREAAEQRAAAEVAAAASALRAEKEAAGGDAIAAPLPAVPAVVDENAERDAESRLPTYSVAADTTSTVDS